MSKKMSFPTSLWNLLINFYLSLQISNRFLEMKLNLIYQLFIVQSFLKKVVLLWLNGRQSLLSFLKKELRTIKFKKSSLYIEFQLRCFNSERIKWHGIFWQHSNNCRHATYYEWSFSCFSSKCLHNTWSKSSFKLARTIL